jgi:hypothetical protein
MTPSGIEPANLRSIITIIIIAATIRILLATGAENVETETVEHMTGAFRKLNQCVYIHIHHLVANTVHPELAIEFVLSKGKPIPHYKYEPHL